MEIAEKGDMTMIAAVSACLQDKVWQVRRAAHLIEVPDAAPHAAVRDAPDLLDEEAGHGGHRPVVSRRPVAGDAAEHLVSSGT